MTMGQVFNANTPENHPVIFLSAEDYKCAMSILAISARMFGGIRIYAFQLMSNHIHLVVGGDPAVIHDFFGYFAGRLAKSFGNRIDLKGLELKLFPVNDLSYFRNAIAYVNRNGFVVNDDVTPFSYPWGSSQYFFQPLLRQFARSLGTPIGLSTLRELIHSKKCDMLKSLKVLDGYILPLEFCYVEVAEMAFRDARQYFYFISRNVETYREVAKSIGESVFYNDDDLYLAAVKMAKTRYGASELRTLPSMAKIDIAKQLHYDYNARDKQIQRLLNIDSSILKSLF